VTRNRQLLVLGVIALLLAGRDFATRIYVGRDDALRRFAAPVIQAVPSAPNAAIVRARLAAWLPATAGSKAADPNDTSAWDLRLTGIFTRKGQRFAVITSTPKGGGPAERAQLSVGDGIKGYLLREIGTHGVTLEGTDGQRQLVMFDRSKRT
jgi:hypothetical protein